MAVDLWVAPINETAWNTSWVATSATINYRTAQDIPTVTAGIPALADLHDHPISWGVLSYAQCQRMIEPLHKLAVTLDDSRWATIADAMEMVTPSTHLVFM